jgi:hypothetical protein
MQLEPLGLWIVDDSINHHFSTPKTKVDVSAWKQFGKIQLSPTMQADTAELSEHEGRFTLAVRPQSRHLSCKFEVGRCTR